MRFSYDRDGSFIADTKGPLSYTKALESVVGGMLTDIEHVIWEAVDEIENLVLEEHVDAMDKVDELTEDDDAPNYEAD